MFGELDCKFNSLSLLAYSFNSHVATGTHFPLPHLLIYFFAPLSMLLQECRE